MRYDDPQRPQIAGHPAYVDSDGNPLAVLQPLHLEPINTPEHYGWRLSAWLIIEPPSGATLFEVVVTEIDLLSALNHWASNPEQFYRTEMDWKLQPKRQSPSKAGGVLTLEMLMGKDLDL